MKKLTMVLILLLAPTVSFAAAPFYRSGNVYTVYNLVHFKDFGAGSANGFAFQLGYDVLNWLALEGHIGMTDEISQDQAGTTVKVRASYASLVGRVNLRFDRTTVFAFAGATSLQEKGSYSGATTGTIDNSDTGATYGFGVDLYGSESTAITLKAVRVYKPKDKKATIDRDYDTTMFAITYYVK